MSAQEANIAAQRREQLRAVTEGYFEALRRKDFSLISVAERSLFPFFNVFEVLIQPLMQSCLNR